MRKRFLDLDDAVKIAVENFYVDEEFARGELEQKSYMSNDQYSIGFYDGLTKAANAVIELISKGEE